MSFYKDKSVLVTGGTGLIGRPLVEMLIAAGAKVTVVSLDDPSRAPKGCTFVKADLREFNGCMDVCKDKEIVFQLAGVKGSPAMTAKRPASFFVPTMQFSINMMEAARRSGAERFLFTSSVGVYQPAEVFYEDSVWTTFPSPNDRFAGWAKRMGELQAEAYKIEYGWDKISIVRPANVYGPFDNFDPENAMVVPSLIRLADPRLHPRTSRSARHDAGRGKRYQRADQPGQRHRCYHQAGSRNGGQARTGRPDRHCVGQRQASGRCQTPDGYDPCKQLWLQMRDRH